MPIKVSRLEFLRHLESVQPGLSPSDITQQSSCFVFKDGNLYTYNDEVACRIKSPLPKNMEGAVNAAPLLATLYKYTEDTIEIRLTKSRFCIHGKGGKETWVAMEQDITMPLEEVDTPDEKKWKKLPPDFIEAIALTQECAGNDEDTFALTCIHIHPEFIEAGDNDQITRYKLDTGVKKSVCVRRDAIKHIVSLGMSEICVGKSWIYFRNGELDFACKRWNETYPDWTPYFKVKGVKTTLPKGLVEACDKALYFAKENESELVKLNIRPGKLVLEVEGVSGGHKEPKKINYTGPKMSFMIGPNLLSQIVRKKNECVMSESAILINGGKWVFVASLELPNGRDTKERDDEKPE